MSVLHVKSETLGDFTGTVTAFDSGGNQVSVAATDLVRPSDWNSGHNEFRSIFGNTFSNSTASGTNIVYSAAGGASIGGSSDTVIFSAPASITTNGLISAVNLSAGTTSNNLTKFEFDNGNGLAFGLSGSTITGSYTVPTVTNSSWTVSDAATSATVAQLAFTNSNGLTLSLSTSNNGHHTLIGSYTVPSTAGLISAVNVSAGTTSNNLSAITFSNANGVTFGLNGSVITASASGGAGGGGTLSYFEPAPLRGQTSTTAFHNATVMRMQPFVCGNNLSMYRGDVLLSQTQTTTSFALSGSVSAGNLNVGTGQFSSTFSFALFSRQDTGANSTNLVSIYSNTATLSLALLATVSWSTNASSATVSFTTSGQVGFLQSFDSAGGTTSGSSGSTGSSTFSSTSTNQNSFSSSFVNTWANAMLSGFRPVFFPVNTSLTPGEYWLGIARSSASGSTGIGALTNPIQIGTGNIGLLYYSTNTSYSYLEIGSSGTMGNSQLIPGWGALANSITSTTFPISSVSNANNMQLWFQLMAWAK